MVGGPVGEPTFGTLVLPNEPWPRLVERWQRLEASGVEMIWSCDHFTNPHRPGVPWYEGWTTVAGMAAVTTAVRVGLLVGAITSRPPPLFVKHAQTVDHLSGGRVVLGLGAGGAPTDQPMWGVEDWSPAERADRFCEYVELVDRMARASADPVDFTGRWYRTAGASLAPGFVQQPRPPLLLAAHGGRTLDAAARYADIWNTYGPTLDDAVAASARLDQACRRVGRDPSSIRRSVLLGLTEGTSWETPGEFADVVAAWYAHGFRDFVFYDPPYSRAGVRCASPGVVDDLLLQVIPDLRRLSPMG